MCARIHQGLGHWLQHANDSGTYELKHCRHPEDAEEKDPHEKAKATVLEPEMLLHRAHMCAMAPRLTGERDRHILLQDSSEWPGKPDTLEPSLTASQTMAAKVGGGAGAECQHGEEDFEGPRHIGQR